MPKAIQIARFGGPEVMEWCEVAAAEPAAGEVRIRHTAVGLNFIDTYHRTGLYPLELPSGLGIEAAGIVDAVGAGVTGFSPGDRVAWLGMPPGAYCEQKLMPASRLIPLPDSVSGQTAAAALLKGMTAWFLLHRSYPVNAGDTVLLYAAAGGVGLITGQWARHLGVNVIGVASTEEKASLARENGCAHVVMADDEQFVAKVREISGGPGVAAVYDSVGRDSFYQSLDCLKPHGTMVAFGNASGAIEPFSPLELATRGSLYLTRPLLFDFIRTPEDQATAATELLTVLGSGAVKVHINQTYALSEAARAHRDLEARKTTGSTVLIP